MSDRVTPNTAFVGRPSGADIGPIPWNIWKISPWASRRYRLPAGGVSAIGGGTFPCSGACAAVGGRVWELPRLRSGGGWEAAGKQIRDWRVVRRTIVTMTVGSVRTRVYPC